MIPSFSTPVISDPICENLPLQAIHTFIFITSELSQELSNLTHRIRSGKTRNSLVLVFPVSFGLLKSRETMHCSKLILYRSPIRKLSKGNQSYNRYPWMFPSSSGIFWSLAQVNR